MGVPEEHKCICTKHPSKGYTAILNLSAKIILSHEGCYRDAQYENHRNKSLYSKMIVQLCVTHKPE